MYQSTIMRKVHEQRLLYSVSLELTFKCNLDCFYCYNDREKPGKPLTLQQYEVLLKDLASMQTMFLMLTGGEPMMHPDFFAIGAIAREQGFAVIIRTNGHSLNRRLAVRLRDEVQPYKVTVSLHGASPEVHDRQTRVPGSFQRLIDNLNKAKEVGLRCELISTPTAWNEHQIEDMFKLSDSLDIPLRFQGPVAPKDNGDTEPLSIQPKPETWDKIKTIQQERHEAETTEVRRTAHTEPSDNAKLEEKAMCSVGVSGVDIDPYGNVQACMHLQESAGNLHEHSIREIWNHAPLFTRARERAVEAARQFSDTPPEQYGAPMFCIAVEENANKGCSTCSGNGCKT